MLLDMYLISALLTKAEVYGHSALVLRADSERAAEVSAAEQLSVDGWKLESLTVKKLELGWHR